MSTEATVDVDALLTPIEGEDPCGEYLRFDRIYSEIATARARESRAAIHDEGARPKEPDWRLVIQRTTEAVQTRSKDLYLAGYLLEALAELHGFAGLRDGFRVLNGLMERYWDGVYPRMAEGDVEMRLGPLDWLTDADRGGQIPRRVRDLTILPSADDGAAISWTDWRSSFMTARGEGESDASYQQRVAEAEKRTVALQGAVAAATTNRLETVLDDLKECEAEVGRFDRVISEHLGTNAPSTSALREALADCAALAKQIFRDKGGSEDDRGETPEDERDTEAESELVDTTSAPRGGPIRSRADAIQRLNEVAAFFHRTEPHSPISYVVERAVRWSSLPLDQLLVELIKDDMTRSQVDELIGLRRS